MAPENNLRPFLRCSDKQFVARLGAILIPVTSGIPEAFDAGEYGTLSTYIIDGSRLTPDQSLALARWIAEDAKGLVSKRLRAVQAGKCRLPDDGQYEVVWLEDGSQFWG